MSYYKNRVGASSPRHSEHEIILASEKEYFVTIDPDTWQITLLSLQISALATCFSLLIGLPLGTLLALSKFPGRSFLLSMVNTGMGLPPVVVGLFVAMMLWRSGPLGDFHLIYTSAGCLAGRIRQRQIRSGCFHDGGWKHSRPNPRADHIHCAGNQ